MIAIAKTARERAIMLSAAHAAGYKESAEYNRLGAKDYALTYPFPQYNGVVVGGTAYVTPISEGHSFTEFMEAIRQEESVVLNADYTLTREGDEIVVGCQRFPVAKLREAYEKFGK